MERSSTSNFLVVDKTYTSVSATELTVSDLASTNEYYFRVSATENDLTFGASASTLLKTYFSPT